MRKTKHVRLPTSFNLWRHPALLEPIVLSGLALALLTLKFTPDFQGVNTFVRQSSMGAGAATTLLSPLSPASARRRAEERFAVSPLHFEENRGQAAADVRFLARAGDSLLFLTRTAAVVALAPKLNPEPEGAPGPWARRTERTGTGIESRPALRIELANSNPNPRMRCSELLPGESNYFLGNDPTHWTTHIPNCAKVRYEHVYPGIDLIYYGNHRQLEYDYLLAAGAHAGQVRIKLGGARSVRVNASGDLIMDVKGSQFRLRNPLAYQNGKNGKAWVHAHYALHGSNLVGVEVEAYDHHLPLIIDPALTYSTFLGGSGGDMGQAMSVDSAGSTYLVGTTSSLDFLTTSGVVQPALAGGSDVFVTKLNPQAPRCFPPTSGAREMIAARELPSIPLATCTLPAQRVRLTFRRPPA